MSTNERGDPVAGPFGNLSHAWCSGLDQLAKTYEPAMRNVGRINLELMGLMTRRAQAWLEVPAAAGRCKTPQELVAEQLKFWQAAGQDYAEASRRLSAAYAAFVGPALTSSWGAVSATARDYITFPEPRARADEQQNRERRAA
jgi:hypothetical protein